MVQKAKILVILGVTSSGKSNLGVELAKKYNGEIISADSRQVYKGLDIGTGKITKREMKEIPHHLLDVVNPRSTFTVAQWKKKAEKAIADIVSRRKVPIVVGGTGFYIQAIVDNVVLPKVKPNKQLRAELEGKTSEELFAMLKKLDPRRARGIDPYNSRRLIRALEITQSLGSVPPLSEVEPPQICGDSTSESGYEVLEIGLRTNNDDILREKIEKRNAQMIQMGLVSEIKKMREQGISKKRIRELGFEYSHPLDYIDKKISKEEALQKMNTATWHYAKRQKTWFKRDKRIKWFKLNQTKKIEMEVAKFLK